MKSLEYKTQLNIFEILASIQKTSAPIELSIGFTKNGTVHQGILIKSAPPIVTQKLIELGYNLDITPDGVRVYMVHS